ncbi:outer membrane lipoprotein-sorting protein [Rhodohalobacter sp. 614A]|uniref:outer membrane lipoprotein-sorting protein n=1 Tax=Rhodohalobacter sp. 614A TaxID=2908649 RepID=UPI001F44713D|nr:outer membrane lipoprotein-sorting protein [Rhodohalobacter sp. 614A]
MHRIILFVSIIWFANVPLLAQERITDESQARTVFEEVEERRNPIETEWSILDMVITDSRGRTRNRTMQSWSQNRDGNNDNLIIFSEPGSVRGTGFLTVNEDGNETQHLYLPSIGRIQVISAAEQGDSFMGSDFTYEDLGDQNPDDYEFQWLETNDNLHTIRATKPESDQYAFVEFDIQKDTYALETVRYYNESEELIKRLESESFEQITDVLWSPTKMTMFDLREDRKTELTWQKREINTDIPDWRFTVRGLRRGI